MSAGRNAFATGLTLLLAVATVSGVAAQEPGRGWIAGRVVDASSGDPVAGASIRVVGTIILTFSDDSGRFRLSGVPAGQRTLAVERIGYAPREERLDVPAAAQVEVEIALEPRAVAVGGVVASVTKRELSARDAPVSVSVLDEAEIERRLPATVADAVAYAPSVQFVGENVNIRGSSGYSRGTGSRVLLLIDGVPANAGDSGALNWDVIPMTEVSRVEVVKGAGSALYGTSALGGVLNVVTSPPPERAVYRIRLRSGFYDDPPHSEWIWSGQTLGYGSVELSHGRRLGPLGLWLRAGRAQDDGYRQNDDSRRTNFAARFGLGLTERDTLGLFASWARERHGEGLTWCTRGQCDDPSALAFQPLRVATDALDDRTRSDKGRLHLTHRRAWSQRFSSFQRFSFQRNDWYTDFGESRVGAVTDRWGGEVRGEWETSSRLFLTLGGEGAYTDVNANLFGSHHVTDLALFAQGELGLTSWLTATAGARGDLRWVDGGSLTEARNSQLSPRLGIVLAPDAATRVRASVGRGFRAPTVAELFTETVVAGFRVEPNPDLKPERSWAGEVGVSRLLTSWLTVDVAGFIYDFDNLIEADTVVSGVGSIEVRFGNLPAARIVGAEAIVGVSFLRDRLQAQAAYTFLDTEDKATGEPLAYRPDHLLTTSASLRLGTFVLGVDYRLASAFDRFQVFNDPRIDPLLPMRVLDGRMSYRFGRQTLRLSVDNATNYAFTTLERNLEPIRRYTAALEIEF